MMDLQNIPPPADFIDHSFTQVVRQYAAAGEQAGQLHAEQVALIYRQKWFNLFVPTTYGGLGLSLPEGLKVEESLAWADGSTGWTVTLCSGANWFLGFLQPGVAKAIFNTDRVCLAGSGRASGIAKDLGGEYEISGYWNYATGAPFATAFTANCVIEKDGRQLLNDDGSSMVQSFLFLREEVTVHHTWNTVGMIATASNSFEVKQLRVPKNRIFMIDKKYAVIDAPIYRYPFQQFAEATLAVNSSGMAARFFELCKVPLTENTTNNNSVHQTNRVTANQLAFSTKQLQDARQNFYDAVMRSWEENVQLQSIALASLQEVTNAARRLAAVARKSVDELYPYCGLAAANPATEINRVWRNLHTASQHPLLLPAE